MNTSDRGALPTDDQGRATHERDEARRERDDARTERDESAVQLRNARAEVDVLKEAEELRELFIGVLAHDLTNPLSAIVATADVILRRGALPEVEYEATARISSSASRALRMIDQLLDFTQSRLGGGLPVHPVTSDLARICRTTIDELQSDHPERVFALEVSGGCIGSWDPDRLARLVGNLIANAIQHGDPGTPVRVQLRDEGENVILQVANQGEPISAEFLPTIFEAFRRRTGENPSQGLGLGLFIARQIVEAHGGSIRVDSLAPARTTTVTVRLPRGR